MIGSRLFRTHFAIAAVSIMSCVFLGAWVLNFVANRLEDSQETGRRMRQTPVFFANYVEH